MEKIDKFSITEWSMLFFVVYLIIRPPMELLPVLEPLEAYAVMLYKKFAKAVK